MKLHDALRWFGIAANALLALGACFAIALGSAPAGAIVALAPFAFALWALIPARPNVVAIVSAVLANALLLVVGLFSAYGLGDYLQSHLLVAFVWGGVVALPVINIVSVLLWRNRAARSNNSFKPKPLRGSA